MHNDGLTGLDLQPHNDVKVNHLMNSIVCTSVIVLRDT